ncbi:hypothetical protein Nmel_001720 [Mimus melanotis]
MLRLSEGIHKAQKVIETFFSV